MCTDSNSHICNNRLYEEKGKIKRKILWQEMPFFFFFFLKEENGSITLSKNNPKFSQRWS